MKDRETILPEEKTFDAVAARKDFPILSVKVHGKPLIYFDNAATSQKPQAVIDALTAFYSGYNANIHRGVHDLSQKASEAYDGVRQKARQFINAPSEKEIVFTRGTTESINLVASSWGRKYIGAGDEILVTAMEHHSNIVPWQMLCEEKNSVLKVIPMTPAGELELDALPSLLSPRTKLVSIVHTSNSLGTINPVKELIRMVRSRSGPDPLILVDGAQAAVHAALDVQDMGCDFFAFSGHKMLGPTGVGVLWGRAKLLEAMPPYQGGGDMISSVSFERTTYNEIPFKFEAGTQNVADVIGLGVAIDYLRSFDRKSAEAHEQDLMRTASERLQRLPGVRLIGTARKKSSVVSFVVDGLNAMDIGMYLDTLGIAVRTGHHCTEPVMKQLNIPGTVRASFLFYNTIEEIDRLIEGVKGAIHLLKK